MITVVENKGNVNIKTQKVTIPEKHASLCAISLAAFSSIADDAAKYDLLANGQTLTGFMDELIEIWLQELAILGIISERKNNVKKSDERVSKHTKRTKSTQKSIQ